MKCYLICSNRPTVELTPYQVMVLTPPDNVTKPFVLNERFQSFPKKRINFGGGRGY
nr:hypothetical protein [Candidatus Enterovibrio luxaltus]